MYPSEFLEYVWIVINSRENRFVITIDLNWNPRSQILDFFLCKWLQNKDSGQLFCINKTPSFAQKTGLLCTRKVFSLVINLISFWFKKIWIDEIDIFFKEKPFQRNTPDLIRRWNINCIEYIRQSWLFVKYSCNNLTLVLM